MNVIEKNFVKEKSFLIAEFNALRVIAVMVVLVYRGSLFVIENE